MFMSELCAIFCYIGCYAKLDMFISVTTVINVSYLTIARGGHVTCTQQQEAWHRGQEEREVMESSVALCLQVEHSQEL